MYVIWNRRRATRAKRILLLFSSSDEDQTPCRPACSRYDRPIADPESVLQMGQGGNEWVLRFMDLEVDVKRFVAEVHNHVQRRSAKEAAESAQEEQS